MPEDTSPTKEDVENCPVRQVLCKVTGKWQVLIILELEEGALRFGALKRAIGDVTQRVLTQNLRGLERDGYITRSVDPGPPVAVHYQLTARGEGLMRQLKTLTVWASEVHPGVMQDRAVFDQAQS
ncbi:MAG: helix-turn-helix domain-containing protein [Litoreibacter sp.]|nr:helix-turn-helix domain-containing protein [Litoreibacter sp.]